MCIRDRFATDWVDRSDHYSPSINHCCIAVSYTHLDVYKRQIWMLSNDFLDSSSRWRILSRETKIASAIFLSVSCWIPRILALLSSVIRACCSAFFAATLSVSSFSKALLAAICCVIPVSYTHLDVYKRQVQGDTAIAVHQTGIEYGDECARRAWQLWHSGIRAGDILKNFNCCIRHLYASTLPIVVL